MCFCNNNNNVHVLSKKKKNSCCFFFFRIVFNLKKQCFQFAYVNLSIGFR